jgi:hypothetical protein
MSPQYGARAIQARLRLIDSARRPVSEVVSLKRRKSHAVTGEQL